MVKIMLRAKFVANIYYKTVKFDKISLQFPILSPFGLRSRKKARHVNIAETV